MTMNDELEVLRGNELFKSFELGEIEELITTMDAKIYKYERKEIIAHEGDRCDSLYIVLSGQVDVEKISEDGESVLIKKVSPAQSFGEMVTFSDISVWPATATAAVDVRVLELKANMIIERGSKAFISNFLSLLSNRALFLNKKMSYIALKKIRSRVSKYLLDIYSIQKNEKIVLDMNRDEMANFLSITRPSLSRELSNMRKEKIIDFKKNTFRILDYKKLIKFSSM